MKRHYIYLQSEEDMKALWKHCEANLAGGGFTDSGTPYVFFLERDEIQDEIEFLQDELEHTKLDSERMVLLGKINELKEQKDDKERKN